VGKNLGFRAGR